MLTFSAHSQAPSDSNRKVPVPVKLLVEVTDSLAVGNMAKREVRRLNRKISEQYAQIAANDSIILSQQKQIDDNNKRISAYDSYTRTLQQIINVNGLEKVNMDKWARKGKKQWNVSISGGYGYGFASEIKRQPFAGITIGKTIFRF